MDFTKGLLLRLWLVAAVSQHFDTWKAVAQGKPCEDELEDCSTYFTAGECEKYNGLTRQYCARTCGYCTALQATRQPECKDLLSDCSVLIKSPSQCHPAKDFFTKYCPMTCGYCACVDLLPDCLAYAFNPGNCQSSSFFTKYCRRSCSLCGEQTTQSATATHPTTGHPATPPPSSAKSSPNPESPTNSSPAPVYSSPKSPPAPESSTNSSPDPIYSSSESSLSSRSFSSTPVTTVTSTTTVTTDNNVLPPGPIGCSDIYPECASRVKNDPELCGEEIMKEQCPESCKLCDVDPYCEDKRPEDCKNRIAEDKTSCKTNPEYMRENCARSCEYCGCDDLLPVCAALVRSNKDYCDSNRLFMKTNCPRSCDFCAETESISDEPQKNDALLLVDPTPPSPPSEEDDCVDRRKRCKLFAGIKDYCRYHTQFMSRYCPKACEFCKKEYNFAIKTEWNGVPIDHAPITFQISAQDALSVRIYVSGPFFDDPGPPPCAVGGACDGLWNYEVAEVFFLGKKEKYLEVELSPHGQHLLLLLNGVRKKFMDKLPIEYTATIDRANKTWSGVARIPIDYFPPDVEKINAYAIHGSGMNRHYQSLYPASNGVSSPDFHRLEFFKPFNLEAMFTVSWRKPLSPLWKNSVRRIMRARARL